MPRCDNDLCGAADDKVVELDDHRKNKVSAWLMTMPPPCEQPKGPFTVTVSDEHGKMFEVVFPDYTGELPPEQAVLGTAGCNELLANLLTGAMRVFLGAK